MKLRMLKDAGIALNHSATSKLNVKKGDIVELEEKIARKLLRAYYAEVYVEEAKENKKVEVKENKDKKETKEFKGKKETKDKKGNKNNKE